MKHLFWRRLAAAAILVSAATLAAAQPASASVVRQPLTGLVRVTDTSTSDSSFVKLASAVCPYGKTVVGTGWSTNPSTSQLRLQFLVPSDRSVLAQVYEAYSGYSSSWSVTVYAMCADRPAGYSLSSHKVSSDPDDDYLSSRVDCPGGTKPLAGGVEHMVPHGQVVVTDLDIDLTGVRVSAYEHEDGYDDDWWIRAYAICADPPTGWQLLSSDNQTSYPTTAEYSLCSAGRTAISAGADLNGAYGEVVLKGVYPGYYQDEQFGVANASEDQTGAPDTWELVADVVCVEQ